MPFPPNFIWGTATASYQIEGVATPDGIGQSVWDMFSRKPGACFEMHNGDVACDHFNRYKEDIAIMRELGISSYRLSLSWPRIIPAGTGNVNQQGLDFYNRLVDELIANNITPWVTLFHWDFPLDLYHQGGWMSPHSPDWFADYSQVVVDSLGNRVNHWFTQNEPQCYIGLGLFHGVHAPGDKLRWAEVVKASHYSMLAHGKSAQIIRANNSQAKIGSATVGSVCVPETESDADINAARERMWKSETENPFSNSLWTDPLILGTYPEDFLTAFGEHLPQTADKDLEIIRQPLDFVGLNIYQGSITAASDTGPVDVPRPAGYPQTAIRWPITDNCLEYGAKFYHERYSLPIIITESGMANNDWVMLDGKVHDPQRIDYLHRHLKGLERAIDSGVPVEGYFQWSLLDNYEWAEGYSQRFGLVHVDYSTQKRTPKDSFHWYKETISQNGANL